MLVDCSILFCALTVLSVLADVSSYELLVTPSPSGRGRFVRPVGSSLAVTCEVTGAGSQLVRPEWMLSDGEMATSTEGRVHTSGDNRKRVLHIASIVDDDAGSYTCFVGNRTHRDKTSTISLSTYVLRVRPAAERFTKPLGSSIVFTCEIQQNGDESSDVSVRWLNQEQKEITESSGRTYVEIDGTSVRKLYVTTIQDRDAGSYTCVGTVEGAESKRTVILKLFKDITFDRAPSPQHPAIHNNWTIECLVSGEPRPDVSWRYNGRRIVTRGRYKVVDKGLQVVNVTEADNGDYTCRAEVEADGRYDERRLSLVVHIPPKMTSDIYRVEGIVGRQAVLTCLASGLPPPTYEFYKTAGVKLLPSALVEVDAAAGRLVFKSVQKTDQGRYSCHAVNDVGVDKLDVDLRVIVPPEITELNNVTQTEGGLARLKCKARGDPTPNITFFRITNYEDKEQVIVSEIDDHFQLRSDAGQLEMVVNGLKVEDALSYSCQAVNSAGIDERTASIVVNYKPRFPMYHNALIYAWVGKTLNISCHVHAHPEPVIEWQHNGVVLSDNASYRIYHVGLHSYLQVRVRESDNEWIYGDYVCQATNVIGENSYPIQLLQASVPDVPQDIRVKESSPDHVVLEVIPPADGSGLEILGYRVQYEGAVYDFDTGGEHPNELGGIRRNGTTDTLPDEDIRLENLRPSTTYILRVAAKNEVGVGKLFEKIIKTDNVREPYPIRINSPHHAVKPNEYILTWDKPRTGGLSIILYEVMIRKVKVKEGLFEREEAVSKWVTKNVVENANQPIMQYRLDGLSSNTYYEIQMYASNKIGRSSVSNSFVFLTGHGDIEPVMHPIDTTVGMTTVLVIIVTLFVVLLLAVDVTCYFANGCGLTMCISVHLCGHGVGEIGTAFKSNEKEVEEGESREMLKQPEPSPKLEMAKMEETPDHTTRESEESQLEQDFPPPMPEEEEEEIKVPLEEECRPKNRRSVLSQGDERWKDIVQELEIRQSGRSENTRDEMDKDDDERAPLTLTNQRAADSSFSYH